MNFVERTHQKNSRRARCGSGCRDGCSGGCKGGCRGSWGCGLKGGCRGNWGCGLKGDLKGSMVVEASIIVPIVLLSITAVLYIALVLYQRAYLQSLADSTVRQAALVWDSLERDMDTGKPESAAWSEISLYWRIADFRKAEKTQKILEYAERKSGRRNILRGSGIRTDVELKNYIVYKKLVATVEDSYKIPLGRLLEVFGLGSSIRIRVNASTILDDPAEFIRNTDFILDVERELEYKNPGIRDLGEKVRGAVDKVKSRLNEFLR